MITTADYIYKRKNGGTTFCYGNIEEDSNFSLVCDNEDFDGIANDIDVLEDKLNTWKRVCQYLEQNYNNKIEQIETC
jgi:hypothetical protein|tara:strand:- start:804 stop:1034 length:231 start_codon:yes stop_codon:yes gene_type:complete